MISNRSDRLRGCVAIFITLISTCSVAAEGIRFEREADALFLNCVDVADALNYEFTIVAPGRLVTFCQGGADGICIPVRLMEHNHRRVGQDLMVTADVLTRALRFRVNDAGDEVTITRQTLPSDDRRAPATPAYNADWQEGRGFRKGETLPDIPLVDLEGNEVRFSQFLGKRYILYCWASW